MWDNEDLSLACGDPANDLGARGAVDAAGAPRFEVDVGGARPLGCREVRGFHEAAIAARDPRAVAPSRLVLIGLDEAAEAWISDWAEDSEQVRRTITIRRQLDTLELTTVATLAAFGYGIDPALSVESITTVSTGVVPALLRSGVHPKAIIEAALQMSALATAESDDAGWFLQR